MPSSHLILCHPLFLLPPIPPSIRVFSNESTLHMRWPKYWSFSLSISPFNEHPGLISFRIDWLDLLAVQGIKSLLQHHSSKASILRHPAFFTVQLSHPYMTTGKTIALTRWTLAFWQRPNPSRAPVQRSSTRACISGPAREQKRRQAASLTTCTTSRPGQGAGPGTFHPASPRAGSGPSAC